MVEAEALSLTSPDALSGEVKVSKRPRRNSAETRAEILAKSEDLFRSAGYAKTSIADIASELGMSPANVFKHFPSKMALAEAIANTHLQGIETALDALPEALAPPERLRRFWTTILACHLGNLRGNPHVFDIVVQMMTTQPPFAQAFVARLQERIRAILLAGNASGDFSVADPDGVAGVVQDCLEGTSHPLLIGHIDPRILEERQARALDLVIAALRGGLEK